MADTDSTIVRFSTGNPAAAKPADAVTASVHETVFFSRREFDSILNLYGKMVASGHWKDYAIDSSRDQAIFSVYRNVHDRPLYQIIKTPKRAARQGAFTISAPAGKILKRGHDIDILLKFFNKKLIRLIR